MNSKWTSRKFWIAIIASVFSGAAVIGFNIPIPEVVITDVVIAVWILAETIIDVMRVKK